MSNARPKYKQIVQDIKRQCATGTLKPGDSLPSINSYANSHGLHRSTVERAYKFLCDMGYAISIQGKGYFLVQRGQTSKESSSLMRVFWSYAHRDDERSGGAITYLRKSIQAEYELRTGDEANIFQDTKDLKWGIDWRKAIGEALGTTTFFIPVITPTYLRSGSCMAELRTAIDRFNELGFSEGIYPIEFVDSSTAIEMLADDTIATLLTDTQRDKHWIDLRLEEPTSSTYRKVIARIVDELLEHEREWDNVAKNLEAHVKAENSNAEDEKGILEHVAEFEEAAERLTDLMQAIGADVTDVGKVFNSETLPKGGGARQAIAVAARLASNLEEPSKSLEKHCKEYDECMHLADCGVNGMIDFYQILKDANHSEINQLELETLATQIDSLLSSTEVSFKQMGELRKMMHSVSRIARPMRKPCQRIEVSINRIASSRHIMESWKNKIDTAYM